MGTFPALTGTRLISLLNKFGFVAIRTRGSHQFLRHADGRCTVVPVHRGETIGRGLLSRILRDCELTVDDLRGHL